MRPNNSTTPASPKRARLSRWNWTVPKETAARLLAEGRLTGEEIAGAVGISRRTLCYWNAHPTFRMRVQQHVEELCEA